jgi:glycosyltransferase involved in cell wall biosynthesis
VVLPAYNAEKTLARTCAEIDRQLADEIILVDDGSHDATAELARQLGLRVFVHPKNQGYGANQKTCYTQALAAGADIVVMLHPDYQYTPRLLPALVSMTASGLYGCVIASRIVGGGARRGGMPLYKYISNRFLTLAQNWLMGTKASEFHTGYRAFTRELLERLPLLENSDDFVFDNQMLSQVHFFGFSVGEVSCPTRYFAEASSINFWRSCRYGLGCLWTALLFRLAKWRLCRPRIFDAEGRKLGAPARAARPEQG